MSTARTTVIPGLTRDPPCSCLPKAGRPRIKSGVTIGAAIRALLLLPLVALAACSPQPEASNESAPVAVDANTPAANVAEPAPPVADDPLAPELQPQPTTIPAKFRGLWAEDQVSCGHLTHLTRLTITDNSLRYPAFVLAVESVTQPTPNSFAVKGFNKKTKAPTEAHFSLDATGNILTDEAGGGTIRVRCA